ncbi:hypothetical protein L3Q67_44975 (plasmid) [Saccharothrix sp. AJ9571]|nr:hypothetical protein L3Q67_44975 [Saccharothrix sp. AJ9571]
MALLVTPGAAVAAESTVDQQADVRAVSDFVQRVHDRWGLTIDPLDYQVTHVEDGTVIHRKDEAVPGVSVTATDRGVQVEGRSMVTAPSREEMKAQEDAGLITIQQETKWYQPKCYERHHDGENVGWLDACGAFGDMNYAGQTRDNMAYKMYASCGAMKNGHPFKELDECYVGIDSYGPEAWNSYSPSSTQYLQPCGDIPLSVTIGPVTAGHVVKTCGKLVPEPEAEPGDMRATWVGDAYWAEDVRETGLLASVGIPPHLTWSLISNWGFVYSECQLPPVIIDTCG